MAKLGNLQDRWRPGHQNTMTAVEQEKQALKEPSDPGKMEFFNVPQKKMGPGYYDTPTEPAPEEVRAKDPKTGGEKGRKLQRFSLIPREFLWRLAEHYGKGAFKYEDRNWEKGYPWSWSLDALERHLNAWLMGERHDPETGTHHLIAVAWHAIALFVFDTRGLGTDDIRTKEFEERKAA
jgi:hypothetical protein